GHAKADFAAGAVRGARSAELGPSRRGGGDQSPRGRRRSQSRGADRPPPAGAGHHRVTGVRRPRGDRDRAAGDAGPDRPRFDDAGGERFRRGGGAQPTTRHGPHSDPDSHGQPDHRGGPRQAQRLRHEHHGEGRFRSGPLHGRSPARHVGAPGGGVMARILIIEDNPTNMTLAMFLLQSAGHVVLSATDAETGLTMARDEQPNLILMDIQLPGMDGLQATKLLKQDVATRAIPVIALTALALKGYEERT